MSLLVDLFKGNIDAACRQKLEENKHYQDAKADLEEHAELLGTGGKVAAFFGIVSITALFLGVGYCAARREGIGEALVCTAVPLAIISYDCYQSAENFRSQVREEPETLMVLAGANEPIAVNVVAVKKCLLNKTLFFEPFMDFFFENFYIQHDFSNVELETVS